MIKQYVKKHTPLVLVILDGFGVAPDNPNSSWRSANLPTFKHLASSYPFSTLAASGIAVGLAWDQEGNSEVGHLTIGAGKIPYQHLTRINDAIKSGSFFENTTLKNIVSHVKKNDSNLHIAGLFSTGTVHASSEHLYALLEFTKQLEVKHVFLHLFTDGKDSPQKEALTMMQQLLEKIKARYPNTTLVSLSGRDFAMDRDDNWERTQKAYKMLIGKTDKRFTNAIEYLQKSYEQNITDSRIEPALLVEENGTSVGGLQSNDALIFFNFREDSMRQITSPFAKEGFSIFKIVPIENLAVATMTLYYNELKTQFIFPPSQIAMPLTKILSAYNIKQLHIAETQKYAHVTYFFNGAREEKFPNEDWLLIPSPKVESFADTPEMSAIQITEKVVAELPNYDFILVNYANADTVGHSGNFDATIQALEVLDKQVSVLEEAALQNHGVLIVTADHGNAEEKRYSQTGKPKSKHSMNPVPFYLIGSEFKLKQQKSEEEIQKQYRQTDGMLSDVAPTILELLNIPRPSEITGISLLPKLLEK